MIYIGQSISVCGTVFKDLLMSQKEIQCLDNDYLATTFTHKIIDRRMTFLIPSGYDLYIQFDLTSVQACKWFLSVVHRNN